MRAGVRKASATAEFDTDERCAILEIANDREDELLSISRARVKPGVITEWHTLQGIDERYIIASGCGRVQLVGTEPADVAVGDVVRIPDGSAQRIFNTGPDDLLFYCVCTPRFRTTHYKQLDETVISTYAAGTNDTTETLLTRVALDEVSAKNQAIHAYDKMIWTVRTGFLTLLFASWGLLLSSLGKAIDHLPKLAPLLTAMFFVSLSLAIGGFVVDLNYIRRKFRVIAAINDLMAALIRRSESETNSSKNDAQLKQSLSVAGDSGSLTYLSVAGYRGERRVAWIIYTIPVLGVAAGAALLWTAFPG